jgi:diguanylate cyclase (GGDEF)-like protein
VWRSIKEEAPTLEVLYEAGVQERQRPGLLDRRVRALRVDAAGESPIAVALRSGTAVEGAGTDDQGGLFHLPTSIAAPLRGRSSVGGVLYADNIYTGRRVMPVTQLVFSLIADHAGRAIENARRFEQMALQARTDALTGLSHHGALMEELGRAVARAQQAGQPLGVAMVDLDDFKRVNDTYGHLAGDALLAGVAARLRAAARTSESPYRYGGEEFTVVLPGADRASSAAVGERLRRAVADRPFPLGTDGLLTVTCTVGVASLPEDGADAESLVAAADAAMLRAKGLGKNRVEQAGIQRPEGE